MAVFRPRLDLIPKSGGLTGASAWMDGVGPPMLIALKPDLESFYMELIIRAVDVGDRKSVV